ncbi:class I SAM-dependent rRNA methyltransferase [Hutsoniella sourekii]|uniref:class I SAM-dependent rRNA methyltransferase n=1 Tax=Hutsoniella sourekii TaxID=87650 RepID=UPI00048A39D6|nr:class I SAM-dependent rRNA methyltransferase [Hutsoniella sourekii]
MKIQIRNQAGHRLNVGERLLTEKDLVQPKQITSLEEGQEIDLVNAQGKFMARALVGRQNKGLAWVFTQDPSVHWDHSFLQQAIANSLQQRSDFFDNPDTTAFRLINGEGDQLGGLTVDYYAGYLQINWYSAGIYKWQKSILEILLELLDSIAGIYETCRFLKKQDLAIRLVWGQDAPQPLMIKENGINYLVYLGQEWMTGIFLDQREVRQFINQQASGRLLNLFSYTGAFSVAALVGQVKETVSVDVANRSLERTRENFEVNGLVESQDQEIRVMDVFDYIKYAKRHQLQFDWVVCDPPSFARTKKYTFSAANDYQSLAKNLFAMTKAGGYTVLSTNHSGYSKAKFQKDMNQIAEAFQASLVHSFGLPGDFPTSQDETSEYLKVLIYYRHEKEV